MARFNFSLGGYQVQVQQVARAQQVQRHAMVSMRTLRALALAAEEPGAPQLAADDEALLHGPGWFDSSWDLECGLDVREGLPGDVRLNEWLTACLRT